MNLRQIVAGSLVGVSLIFSSNDLYAKGDYKSKIERKEEKRLEDQEKIDEALDKLFENFGRFAKDYEARTGESFNDYCERRNGFRKHTTYEEDFRDAIRQKNNR